MTDHVTTSTALLAAVAAVLRDVDADIAARRPVCRASGNCCKFEAYGHRLYVTAVELAFFAAQQALVPGRQHAPGEAPKSVALPQFFAQEKAEGCPYQIDNLCTAREARPLGCRIYFCDENAQSWQNEVYERYHGQLRALHERYGLPYRYLEWRAALRELVEPESQP